MNISCLLNRENCNEFYLRDVEKNYEINIVPMPKNNYRTNILLIEARKHIFRVESLCGNGIILPGRVCCNVNFSQDNKSFKLNIRFFGNIIYTPKDHLEFNPAFFLKKS